MRTGNKQWKTARGTSVRGAGESENENPQWDAVGFRCGGAGEWRRVTPGGEREAFRSRLGERDLAGGAQVGKEVADLVVGQGFEQAFGHQGNGGFFARDNLGLCDRGVLAD